jgi:hypothetical protein
MRLLGNKSAILERQPLSVFAKDRCVFRFGCSASFPFGVLA